MFTRSQNTIKKKKLNKSFVKTLKSRHQAREKEIIIRKLISSGADINHIDAQRNTPLHLASSCDEVSLLLKLGADVNIRNLLGETPLLHIIKNSRTGPREKLFKTTKAIIMEFIKKSHSINLKLNIKDSKGNSPLFEYVRKNECDLDIVQYFISRGANYKDKSSNKNSLLHIAVSNPRCKSNVIKYLIQLGLNPNAKNSSRQTPLHLCVRNKPIKLDIVKELMNHDANLMKRDITGYTPFYYAVENNCNEVLLSVLLSGIKPSFINERIGSGDTILHKLVTFKNINVIIKLISWGANVNATNEKCCTPLHSAVKVPYCDEKIVTLLVKHGANVNARNNKGNTPLHLAFKYTANMAVIKTLLQCGAKMANYNVKLYSPLHYLISNPNFEESFLIELLSIEYSTGTCLQLTCLSHDFPSKCFNNHKINILKIVLKYLFLKDYSLFRLFPFMKTIFFGKLSQNEWNLCKDFYNVCMSEIHHMMNDTILDQVSFYSIMVKEFSRLTELLDDEIKKKIIDAVLVRMTNNKYPIFKDMLLLYVRKRDFLLNLDAVLISCTEYRASFVQRITLPQCPVRHIAQYLSKQDVINLILAYSNLEDLEAEGDMSNDKENKRIPSDVNLNFSNKPKVE